MWCLFKKSKYSSTRLESLGYLPQLDMVQKFWKLCEQQLSISGLVDSHTLDLHYYYVSNSRMNLSHDINSFTEYSFLLLIIYIDQVFILR